MSRSIHFVCRDREGLHCIEHPVYESGNWDVTKDEAESLIGGTIYLHQTKATPSYFGGRIHRYREVETDAAHTLRIAFSFQALMAAKGAAWRGANHPRAECSGVVEDQ